jgi:hypothetical protein
VRAPLDLYPTHYVATKPFAVCRTPREEQNDITHLQSLQASLTPAPGPAAPNRSLTSPPTMLCPQPHHHIASRHKTRSDYGGDSRLPDSACSLNGCASASHAVVTFTLFGLPFIHPSLFVCRSSARFVGYVFLSLLSTRFWRGSCEVSLYFIPKLNTSCLTFGTTRMATGIRDFSAQNYLLVGGFRR